MTRDEWKIERQKLIDCAKDVDDAIRDSHRDSGFMSLRSLSFDELIGQYGIDRINQVFAATIRDYDYDGRIRPELKDWARGVEMPPYYDEEQSSRYYVLDKSGAGLTDVAANAFLRVQHEHFPTPVEPEDEPHDFDEEDEDEFEQ